MKAKMFFFVWPLALPFLLIGHLCFGQSSYPAIPLSYMGAKSGVATLDSVGRLTVSSLSASSLRPPGPNDDANNFIVNSLWSFSPYLYTLNYNVIGDSIWFASIPPLTPCDAIGNTCGGGVAYSCSIKLQANATKACQLTRIDTLATTDVGFNGYLVDYAAGDAFCAGATSTVISEPGGCYISKQYDQSGHGYDAVQPNMMLFTANINGNGGSGYTSQNNVSVTLSNTGGTCSTSTVLVAKITSGVFTATNSITTQGICTVPPTQPQGIASCSPSCGAGTGAGWTVTYNPQGGSWLSTNVWRKYRASVINSYQYTAAGYNAVTNYYTFPTLAWTPNSSTIAIVNQAPNSTASYPALTTNDGNYGVWMGNSGSSRISILGATTPGTANNTDGCGLLPDGLPELYLQVWNGTTATCWEGNQTGTKTTTTSPPAQTGGIIGSNSLTKVSIFDNYLTMIFPTVFTTAQQLAFRQSVAAALELPMHYLDYALAEGGSNTSGRASMIAGSPPKDGYFGLKYPIMIYNAAQSGLALASLTASFGTGLGDDQFYKPNARTFIASYAGLANDISNIENNGQTPAYNGGLIHGLLAHYVWEWKNKATTGQTPVKVLLGLLPINCSQQADPLQLPIYNVVYPDVIANATLPQPTGPCNTDTACESGGLGADGFFNPGADVTVGYPIALTGGIGGTFPVLQTPLVPYCSATYGVGGDHATDLTQHILASYWINGVNALLP